MSDAERERLVDDVVGHLLNGVSEPVLQRCFDYWRNVDTDIGDRIEKGCPAVSRRRRRTDGPQNAVPGR